MSAPLDRISSVVAVAARHAEEVDREARFPFEAFAALKDARLLSLLIPVEFGGDGARLAEVAEVCSALGQHCASTAMIFAMHQIKVSSLVSYGAETDWGKRFLRRVSDEQLLLASATTEGGVGGNMRASVCAFEREGSDFRVEKRGALISYGAQADAILVTARRAPDAAASDQLMAAITKDQYTLSRTGVWDTLGMRGTCSDSFILTAKAPTEQILGADFAEIAAQSMLATAHLLWGSVWYGVAVDALVRAQNFVRAEARKGGGGLPPGALRLAEASTKAEAMRAALKEGLARFECAQENHEDLNSMSFGVRFNNLKTFASETAIDIINHALLITGISGYRNDSPHSVGRHMRDALSARIMISNDRIYQNLSNMLLAHRLDPRLS
ncbi:acyl-CoA dehydrogenase family protein [Methylocystis sp. JR02]|uniref:acyl-CoA dehydrogenase family protein n=1 Tax=Methylocystis sp. JR02 TaxID=3046284 RepID=UPI0024B8A670|nr:acyl-CoA dehydrogenase family protein [Methylocystis sp. JR02]MDJ0448468.1 acyl-CoA dehydrogenase family protein [Methylocystis sp. JR02]